MVGTILKSWFGMSRNDETGTLPPLFAAHYTKAKASLTTVIKTYYLIKLALRSDQGNDRVSSRTIRDQFVSFQAKPNTSSRGLRKRASGHEYTLPFPRLHTSLFRVIYLRDITLPAYLLACILRARFSPNQLGCYLLCCKGYYITNGEI